jgi:metal-responsive CopG/Arc/MetJ family transcriptional regulator
MARRTTTAAGSRKVRISVSLPPESYAYLERVAQAKRVSLAWVVRDAVEKYVEAEKPLHQR